MVHPKRTGKKEDFAERKKVASGLVVVVVVVVVVAVVAVNCIDSTKLSFMFYHHRCF
jgi:uncharacterized integral membrane protein